LILTFVRYLIVCQYDDPNATIAVILEKLRELVLTFYLLTVVM